MKFTKIMALVLALLMLVCAFAACGGNGDDTTLPVESDTNPPVDDTTAPPETDPVEECKHTRTREVPGSRVEPTCTVDGKYTMICRSCDYTWDEVIPAGHTYTTLKSTNGEYVKYFCSVCSDSYVANAATNEKVADASAIEFPFFYTSFDDVVDFKNIADKFEDVDYKDAFAVQVVTFTDGAETNAYANVPTGTSAQNANGFFELTDKNNAFASKVFTISFNARFDEYPLTGKLDLLTWNIGGAEYVLLAVDGVGDIYVIGNNKSVASFSDKGWDKITVKVDPATGKVEVEVVGADEKTVSGEGKLGASVTGKTASSVKFFNKQGQFEAYIDELLMSVAK